MFTRPSNFLCSIVLLLVAGLATTTLAQSVIFDVTTQRGDDTLYTGQPGSIIFSVDANGNRVAALGFIFEVVFSHGNLLGTLVHPGNIVTSAEAQSRFESFGWNAIYGQGTDPDTIFCTFIDFGGSLWDISGEVWRINVTPSETGRVRFDSLSYLPPSSSGLSAISDLGGSLPIEWLGDGRDIVVIDSGTMPPGPVIIRVGTTSGDDILRPGGSIVFTVDANGNEIAAMSFPLLAYFSGDNFIGPVSPGFQFNYSAKAREDFENLAFNTDYGCSFTDAPVDTLLFGALDFNNVYWTASGELCRLTFSPTSTGTVRFDSTPLPPVSGLYVYDPFARPLAIEWISPVIQVAETFDTVLAALPTLRMLGAWGSDTFFAGSPATIEFFADPGPFTIDRITVPLLFQFTNGNLIGPVRFGEQLVLTTLAETAFDFTALSSAYGDAVTDPDSLLWVHEATVGPAPGLTFDGVLARLRFVAQDTGSFTIDSAFLPPTNHMEAYVSGMTICPGQAGLDWRPTTFHVVPCPVDLMGDVNADGARNSGDVIYFVNYIFKSGPEPLPERSAGDVNCTGGLTGADIIYLVNYVFKSGPEPCGCFVKRI